VEMDNVSRKSCSVMESLTVWMDQMKTCVVPELILTELMNAILRFAGFLTVSVPQPAPRFQVDWSQLMCHR